MSRPSEGNYVIYSRILSPSGEKLAITYSGTVNEKATLTPLDKSSHQIWVLKNSGSTAQSVSPQSATGLQAAWGGDYVNVQSAGGYVWNIKSNDDGYTIRDGGNSVYWGADKSTSGSSVSINTSNGVAQRWVLEKV